MESYIEPEFECQICMDLLVEPTTTVCGHTFCKICLIRYLKTKLNCPMCRKPILQSKESLAKNVILENIIKAKYSRNYEERLKIAKLSYDEESHGVEDNFRNNIPSIIIQDCYVWPKMKKKVLVFNLDYEHTLNMSSVNDRLLVIIPQSDTTLNNISSLVEISTINKKEHRVEIEVVGLKRFKVAEFRQFIQEENNSKLYISSGEIVKDMEIESQELLNEIKQKLEDIQKINEEILSYAPSSFASRIENIYGKPPTINNRNLNVSVLEPISFYYLNILKNENKKSFYQSNNIYQRVTFILDQYTNAENHLGNQSLPLNFYDLNLSGMPKNQLKFTIILFICIFIFGLAYRYKLIRIN